MGPSTAEQTLADQNVLLTDDATTPAAEVVLRRLAACMSHNVNNALTAVIGYLELSVRDGTNKGNLQSHLQAGLACAYQAADTIKRLVVFASQQVPTGARAPVALRQLAEEAAFKVRNNRGSGLSVVVTGSGDGLVFGNAALLRSALEQIVRNAVEAMPKEGTLTFRLEEEPCRARLHVCDTGPGLSAEAEAHLYDPFWTTKRNGHLGLGLVLCRDTLEAQGGTLRVTAVPGAGTIVTLSVPTAVTEEMIPSPSFADEDDPALMLAPSSGALVSALN